MKRTVEEIQAAIAGAEPGSVLADVISYMTAKCDAAAAELKAAEKDLADLMDATKGVMQSNVKAFHVIERINGEKRKKEAEERRRNAVRDRAKRRGGGRQFLTEAERNLAESGRFDPT